MKLMVSELGHRTIPVLQAGVSGRVHSAFTHAANLLLQAPGATEEIHVTVLGEDAHPMALTCQQHLLDLRGIAGAPVQVFDGVVRVGEVELILEGGGIWQQPTQVSLTDAGRYGEGAETLSRLLDGTVSASCKDVPQWRQAWQVLHNLRSVPFQKADLLLPPLVGVGPGLTPVGDDFISGWLVCQTLMAKTEHKRSQCRALGWRLSGTDTTFFSQSQIRYAGCGFCLRSMFELLQAVCQNIDIANRTLSLL